MANYGKEIALAREGTDQNQRFIDALNPDSLKLNDFSLNEWLQFAYKFAHHVNYFSTLDFEQPDGNWERFFVGESELEEFLQRVGNENNITPHLALFVSFVWLLGFTNTRFNRLTKRHLDFYYRNILKIEKLPPTPDKVHLIFELAKKSMEERVPAGTELDGGKDANGQKRIYKTTDELIANQIKVAQLKSVYNTHESNKIKAAETANSFDGQGADFPDDEIQWWPFGYFEKEEAETSKKKEYPELADAKLGFALSSEILQLQEGERNIRISVGFNSTVPAISATILTGNLEVWCTGEKGWLGPFEIQSEITDENGDTIYSSGMNMASKKLTLAFQIPPDQEPVMGYDSEVHGENFNTELPVCRILIHTENTSGHSLYRQLVEKEVKTLSVDVDVREVKSLVLENDNGTLNAEKPFLPFGTQPVKRSNFYIGYPELFSKNWGNIEVAINWKNTPGSFVDLYSAYMEEFRYNVTPANYLDGDDPIVKEDSYFTANIEVLDKEKWVQVDNDLTSEDELTLFISGETGYQTSFSVKNDSFETGKNGPVRLSLNQSFLHELFARIFALAFSSDDDEVLIPNEPYTPLVETISLNYTASAAMNLAASAGAHNENPVQLYHEHPFGQAEEHPWLKSQLNFLEPKDKKTYLLPVYCKGGELYIGLEDAKTLQQVSLLVQVIEGTENPEAESFVGKQKVEWSVLCQNQWKPLDADYMIANETDNFLKSGIVKFSVPKEANTDNTRLQPGLVWVKAKIHKNYDAVCKAIAIHAQAVMAEFSDNQNELSHLENGLEAGAISKLIQRLSAIKGVSQPYSSFDGKPEESDDAYYRRISERLRHKNRAITIWDYENLILQNFPDVHKVKCLNHTSESSFLSPGNVYIVVIPDIVNKNVFDIYQPRLSTALLNEIQDFINQLNTLHVNAVVANPDYEKVTVELKVKFRKGYDESFYLKKLNEDITRLLSPWAFSDTAKIQFGTTLHRSTVIHYLEQLEYVDFLEDVKLHKGDEMNLKYVNPDSPKAILVSARQHVLAPDTSSCKVITETEETCQT